ncbi:hypothetical protein HCJ46_17045 [Listeria booriae]|uniref:hypothetical protein n=1 Tax=Listeria booriae TaxID=1552123 RepID=UPI0016296B74|nr:hypothetical protein [Listeria booriae]MBC1920460.1 hypothetical protein [Listeria booriae]
MKDSFLKRSEMTAYFDDERTLAKSLDGIEKTLTYLKGGMNDPYETLLLIEEQIQKYHKNQNRVGKVVMAEREKEINERRISSKCYS